MSMRAVVTQSADGNDGVSKTRVNTKLDLFKNIFFPMNDANRAEHESNTNEHCSHSLYVFTL